MNDKKTTGQKAPKESPFINDLIRILIFQFLFQAVFTFAFYKLSLENYFDPIQYINISAYFLILIISITTLKYTIASRPLVILFIIQYLYYAAAPHILIGSFYTWYNLQVLSSRLNFIIMASVSITITAYLFFYSISPKHKEAKKHVTLAILVSSAVILLSYSNIDLFTDFSVMTDVEYRDTLRLLHEDTYYVYLINLSFLLFIWFTFKQGQYVLSEYLPAILAIHTLMIVNEIYQLYNFTRLLDNFIPAQYFNTVVNIGFIVIWLIRLKYLGLPESRKDEHYIINYDLLKGFVEKPHNNIWDQLLVKAGKQRLFVGSVLLFLIISVPLLFLGELNFFTRFNIILMLLFLMGVMIFAIVYTQKKWFNHIGFLIQRKKLDGNSDEKTDI